mmetsp:Transcript_6188/g.20486  ORF Transcript_6188/g.20486 Transcript_6188/m.20486 type:complete len:152 (-) Transcript_6188:447-902(-)
MYVPALFCVVRSDSFISNRHSDLLHANYAGDKFILAVDGDHNEVRPPSMHVQLLCYLLLSSGQSPMQVFVRRFLQRYMQVPAAWALESRQSIFSTLVPWHQTHGRILQETSKSAPAVVQTDTHGEQATGMGKELVDDVHSHVSTLIRVVLQ